MEVVQRSEPQTYRPNPASACLPALLDGVRLTWACDWRKNLLYVVYQVPNMSWGSRPNREVISWVDIFGQTLFGLEDSVQDLVQVPLLEAGIENMLLGFCITFQSMLIKGLLEFCLCYW